MSSSLRPPLGPSVCADSCSCPKCHHVSAISKPAYLPCVAAHSSPHLTSVFKHPLSKATGITTRAVACAIVSSKANKRVSWDDWTEEERLRKLTDENRDLERSLRKDQLQKQRAVDQTKKASSTTSKRRSGIGAEGSSARGSEDRASSAAVGPRGTKRSRADAEQSEKVQFSMTKQADQVF